MINLETRTNKVIKVHEQEEEEQEESIENTVQKTAQVALQSMQKELEYEQLALKEEIIREREEEIMFKRQLEDERAKQKYIEI